ncbi:hypothetical protein GW950_00800 [Candidatus Wolfebacteria bacterium]|nr:hypothetical protein [Candidatus Wolfebacteria bacterium]
MFKIIKKNHNKLLIFLIAVLFTLASSLAFFAIILSDLPNPQELENRQIAQSTKIFDRTGEVLLYEVYGEEKRTTISYEDIPNYVKWATVSIEDKDFYNHKGFNALSIIQGAVIEPLTGQRDRARGGSTITQQLAKNAFLTSERTIIRKVKELFVAFELEDQYSKDEILNLYLNQIPYGGNAYGIQAAAKTFFDKDAKDLTLAQSALLASLPKASSYYSPWGKHVDELLVRKDTILERMFEQGYITEKEKNEAQKEKLEFSEPTTIIKAPHFVLDVQEYLNNKYGESYVRTSGLTVITTLDWDLQQVAEKSVLEGGERNEELYQGHNAALVAQDATTGQILALAGSKDYFGEAEPENCTPGLDCRFEGNFNVATQGLRQPGSTMKPFAYVTAFKNGYSPDTIVFDLLTEFASNNPNCPTIIEEINEISEEHEECFHPHNFDNDFRGPVTLRTALSQSINVPAVKTLYLAGIDNTLKTATDFGITTLTERSRYGLSLVLGGGEITLKELVGAYSVFAQEGLKHNQTSILKITDSKENVIEEYKDKSEQVIDPQYPRLINDVLTDLNERAGLFSSSLPLTIFEGHEVALKTGTTNDYRDAWTMGYTPELVVGVWAGNNNNESMKQRGSSLLAAVPIWNSFMKEALKDRNLVAFNRPDLVLNTKAMLRGEYVTNYKVDNKIYPHIHSLLFYVNKKDPKGDRLEDPTKDSQFNNWEDTVLKWAEENVENFSENYNFPIPNNIKEELDEKNIKPIIDIVSPLNGTFIQNGRILVQAKISNQKEIKIIQLLFNNQLVDVRTLNLGKEFIYQFNLVPSNLEIQNLLKINVIDLEDKESSKEIILYK